MSSSSSPSGNQEPESRTSYRDWIHDVFMSFPKEDSSSHEFVSDLYARFKTAGVRVFKDEMEPGSGDQILFKAIEGSRVSIIVFSRNYANSTWCLQELEKIMECRSSKGQKVVPVYYGLDPLEVRDQSGHFGEALVRMEERKSTNKNKVLSYRIALKEAAGLPGFVVYFRNGKESEAIGNIVEQVADFLDGTGYWLTVPNVVGLNSRVQDLIQLLNYHKSDDVLLLGIAGMAGIGKTTIAMALYNQISHNFEARKFFDNIRKRWEHHGKVSSQEELLCGILPNTMKTKIHDIESGKLILKKSLCRKRILLVLDDVTESDQLKALCGSRDWFGPGSRIIITTRDKDPLNLFGIEQVYTVKEMDYNESIEILGWHAFENREIPEGNYRELAEHVVEYCGGLPVALEVLGYDLYGKTIEEWESALEKLKTFSHCELRRVVRVNFDSLDNSLKRIFLEIACFFVGTTRNDVVQILNCFGISEEIGILEDKCLVTVDEKSKLQMNKLLQRMGREIVCQASSIIPELSTYDIFLSFRGKDTRATFASHLQSALENAGFYVFKDDVALLRGEWISIALLDAIRESRISVVVLSTNYAGSRWCLQELEDIMQCYRTTARAVVPIFYGVDPCEVRNQTGIFGQAFEDLIKRIPVNEDKVLSWRTSLRAIGSLSGIVVVNSRNESDDIKKVVEDITRLLDKTELFVADYPVGVTSRVQNAIELLKKQQSKDVLLLGICGMGGIGKTTIAKAIYNQIGRNFDGRCCLLNIREVWEQDNGQVSLQERLLSDIYKTTRIVIRNIESGKNELKNRLRQKKVLLVLDDVNKLEQMNALCRSHEWFSPGSYIIITTRDEHLVRVRGANPVIYRLKEMDESEAVELFSWHAFKQSSPKEPFVGLSRDVVAYSSGLPLALEVLGSYLCDREIAEWKNALEKLKRIPNHEIQKKLRISFDSLNDDTEKEIFLDIACFFIGMNQSDVIQILNDCGLYAKIGISVLIERYLVTVNNKNKLGMHNLLRDMGREIICEKSRDEPEKRSRLWLYEEVFDVLTKYKGTKAIKGLALKSPRTNPISFCTKAFKKMKKLRLLQLAGVQLDGDFKYLSRDLIWMNWHGFPLSHTPKDCYQESLVAIELEYSNLKLAWKEAQLLNKLKILNLSHSYHLRQTPDFSYLPNLEKLILKDCPSLCSVSHTIGHLNQLLLINLKDCTSLRSLPRSIYKLKSLKTLILSGCLMIDKLEEDMEQMESLTILKANNTAITQVPNALVRLKSIRYISLGGFEGLARDVIPSIIWSWTSPTNKLSSLMQTSTAMSSIVTLDIPCISLQAKRGSQLQITGDVVLDILNATNSKESEATTSHVSNLNTSALIDCRRQGDISGSKNSLYSLLIQMGMNCPVAEILKENISQKLRNNGPGDFLLPGDKIPDWLTFNGEGPTITFEVPRVNGRNLKTVMLCIVYSSSSDIITSEGLLLRSVLIINYTKGTTHIYEGDTLTSLKDEDWQSIITNLEPGDKVHVVVMFGNGFIVKKTSIYFIYDEPIDQNMEHLHADVIVSGADDMPIIDKNLSVSGSDDVAENKKCYFSGDVDDTPADNKNDIVSGEDENEDYNPLKKRKLQDFDDTSAQH